MTQLRAKSQTYILSILITLFCCAPLPIVAATRTVNLTIANQTVYFAGKPIRAIAVNNQIPGPTLRFREGDEVNINVTNQLDKETAVHWHGLLVPWQMDGVLGLSQHGIQPGETFHYQFTLKQAGTYWYHAHAGLQEQQGLYGAFIIDPKIPEPYHYTQDYAIVLSDWSNTQPEKIYANLKKSGDYYAPKFPLQSSLAQFMQSYQHAQTAAARQQVIDDYKMMLGMGMSLYDLSDIAYDAFLLNGHNVLDPWTAPVKIGDSVRLRFIGAGASTLFHVKIPGTKLQVVHVQGNDVKPYTVDQFSIGPGQTIDVLVKITEDKPYIIYAESSDKVGKALGALVTRPHQPIAYSAVTPFPNPQPVNMMNHSGMAMPAPHEAMSGHTQAMMGHTMPMHGHAGMATMASMAKSAPQHAVKANTPDNDYQTMGTPYQNLVAHNKTNDPNRPIAETIKMELGGYMDRYMWFINGVPLSKAKPIIIAPGKRYRLILINPTMMHHPMHIHGHFFILRNGHGAYDPLLHTIDLPPNSTAVADFEAEADGQWFFHCHQLYHMLSGMGRVFRYSNFTGANHQSHNSTQAEAADLPKPAEDFGQATMIHPEENYMSVRLELGADPFNNLQRMTVKALYGSDENKIELHSKEATLQHGRAETADLDIFYWRLLNPKWAAKLGANYVYRPASAPYWQPGIALEGSLPYAIDTDARLYYHAGSAKLDLELSRDNQITNNFFLRLGVRAIAATQSALTDEIGSGLNQLEYTVRPYYRLMPGLSVFSEFQHESKYGALANALQQEGQNTSDNTVTFGFSVLF